MTNGHRKRRRVRREPNAAPTLPPLPFPEAANANLRYTLRAIAHPRGPRNLLLAIAWAYRHFPPPDGDTALIAETEALLAEHDQVVAHAGPAGDPFFTGMLDGFVEETLDIDLPANLSGREILEAFLVVATGRRDDAIKRGPRPAVN